MCLFGQIEVYICKWVVASAFVVEAGIATINVQCLNSQPVPLRGMMDMWETQLQAFPLTDANVRYLVL